MRLWWTALLLSGCNGLPFLDLLPDEDPATEGFEVQPELCGDGIDNNGNGLVDCDDAAYCAGPECRISDPPTTPFDRDQLQIDIVDAPCDVVFRPLDCPRELCTFVATNDSPDLAHLWMDVALPDLESTYDTPFSFDIGDDNPLNRLNQVGVAAGDALTVTLLLSCTVEESFTVEVHARAEGTDGAIPLWTESTFEVSGTYVPDA